MGRLYLGFALLLTFASGTPAARAESYAWKSGQPSPTLAARFAPPSEFIRDPVLPGSFAAWLRGLPMKPAAEPVRLFNGAIKPRQDVHAAVVDIDVGTRDLQQCADAIMRLRAEWLFAADRKREIGFNFTSGARVDFERWSTGNRPSADGRTWSATGKPDGGYASFKRYMTQIFAYAGTASLEKELTRVKPGSAPEIGDLFIKGGFPGHAVLVVDKVRNPASGEVRILLLQSFMPAQDMHILRQPTTTTVSPWYATTSDGSMITPEWTFAAGSLRRWP
ncbi:MAG: DUF4846 domain-containing protein [Hyphomicrobiaceae bacterium]